MVQNEGRPWVIAKTAMSLDGQITRPEGEGQWLTGLEAREQVQILRGEVDAIVTSGETLRQVLAEAVSHRRQVRRWLDTVGVQFVEFLHVIEDRIELGDELLFFLGSELKASQCGYSPHILSRDSHNFLSVRFLRSPQVLSLRGQICRNGRARARQRILPCRISRPLLYCRPP